MAIGTIADEFVEVIGGFPDAAAAMKNVMKPLRWTNTQAGQAGLAKSRYHKRLFTCLTTDVMTENDYSIAWGLYAFAALGCLLVWFLMTRWMWRYLREPLVVIVAVLLFTPTMIDAAKEIYAPAVAITALDLLFKVGSNVWNALSDLAMYGMIALIVYAVFALIRWPLEKSWKARHPDKPAQPGSVPDGEEVDDEPYPARDRYAQQAAPSTVNTGSRSRVEPRL